MKRNLLALSLKHTPRPSIEEFTFWGKRTNDDEKRSFGGYSYAHCAELYTMEEFKKEYNWSEFDYSKVYKTEDIRNVKNFHDLKDKFDTIFIEYDDFIEVSTLCSEFYKQRFKIQKLEKEKQDLIEKLELATKKKPRIIYDDEPTCPNCFEPIDDNMEHCACCDQRIDWNDY